MFINTGTWEVQQFQENALKELRAFDGLVAGGRKPFWMTTPLRRQQADALLDANYRDTPGYDAAVSLGWPILDRFEVQPLRVSFRLSARCEALRAHSMSCRSGITLSLAQELLRRGVLTRMGWADEAHMKNYVTQQFNILLLNILCSAF